MQNFHIIQVKHVPATNQRGNRVKITSERFKENITIPYNNLPGSGTPALDTAILYLKNKGFGIIGKGEGKDHYYLITHTFQPLKNPVLNVKFLIHPKENDLFAYFPDEMHNKQGTLRTCYSHIGQHSSCSPEYAAESRPATPEEYKDLKNELENIGYYLNIVR